MTNLKSKFEEWIRKQKSDFIEIEQFSSTSIKLSIFGCLAVINFVEMEGQLLQLNAIESDNVEFRHVLKREFAELLQCEAVTIDEIMEKISAIAKTHFEIEEVGGGGDDDMEMDDGYYDDAEGNEAAAEISNRQIVPQAIPAQVPTFASSSSASKDQVEESLSFFAEVGNVNRAAINRLLKDYKMLKASGDDLGFVATPRKNSILVWDFYMKKFPTNLHIWSDLQEYAKKFKTEPHIHFEMQFPPDYPMSPPFVRILKPKFQFLTGHVTLGGSICMEALTRSGWTPTDIESIMVNIHATILSDPNVRLNLQDPGEYSEREARDAFQRMVQRYGWK